MLFKLLLVLSTLLAPAAPAWAQVAAGSPLLGLRGTATLPAPALDVALSGGTAFVAAGTTGLLVVDVSDPANPTQIGGASAGTAIHVAVAGHYVYVSDEEGDDGFEGIHVFDVSTPGAPQEVASLPIEDPGALEVHGSLLFVLDRFDNEDFRGLIAVSVADASAPFVVGSARTDGEPRDLAVEGERIYVASSDGVEVFAWSERGPIGVTTLPLENATGIAAEGPFAYVAALGSIEVIDASDPEEPTRVGSLPLAAPVAAAEIEVQGGILYVGDPDFQEAASLFVVDARNPTAPVARGAVALGDARGVAVVGGVACVASAENALHVVDVARAASPPPGERLARPGFVADVDVEESPSRIAHLADEVQGLRLVSVANPAQPEEIAAAQVPGRPTAIDAEGGIAYVGSASNVLGYIADGGLHLFDVSIPQSPAERGSVRFDAARDVDVEGDLAYVADDEGYDEFVGLRVIDVEDATEPLEIGSLDLPSARGIDAEGTRVYVAAGEDGACVVDVSEPSAPSRVSCALEGEIFADDLAVDRDLMVVVEAGEGTALHVLDLTDPDLPVPIGVIGIGPSVRDVELLGTLAYLTLAGNQMIVVDVTDPASYREGYRLGAASELLGIDFHEGLLYAAAGTGGLRVFDVPTHVGLDDADALGLSNAEDVERRGNYAFVAARSAGVYVMDVSQPWAPRIAAVIPADYADDIEIDGDTAYVAGGQQGLLVVDVSNPENPGIPAVMDTPVWLEDVVVENGRAYLADHNGGLLIYDVTSPASPVLLGSYSTPGAVVDVKLRDGRAYLAETRSSARPFAGFEIVDVADPAAPALVGAFPLVNAPTLPTVSDILVAGDRVFLSAWTAGVVVADISNPALPVEVGRIPTTSAAYEAEDAGGAIYSGLGREGLAVSDATSLADVFGFPRFPVPPDGYAWDVLLDQGIAYVANFLEGFRVMSLFRRETPYEVVEIGALALPGPMVDVEVVGTLVYAAEGEPSPALRVIDASNPRDPRTLALLPRSGEFGLGVRGALAVLAGPGVGVVDVSDPASPTPLGSLPLPESVAVDADLAGTRALVADPGGAPLVIDVASPAQPFEEAAIPAFGARDVQRAGPLAFLAGAFGELLAAQMPAFTPPTVEASIPLGNQVTLENLEFDGTTGAVAAGVDGFRFVEASAFSDGPPVGALGSPDGGFAAGVDVEGITASLAHGGGVSFADVGDPSEPALLATVPLPGVAVDVETVGTRSYVATREGGLVILDHASAAAPGPLYPPLPECRDGIDNDGDGRVDFPEDTDCLEPDFAAELGRCRFDDPTDTDEDGIPDSCDNCTLDTNANQRDTNGDGFGNWCDADFDGDGLVNLVDLQLFFREAFFRPVPDADFDGDGIVNLLDLRRMKQLFLRPPGPSGRVP